MEIYLGGHHRRSKSKDINALICVQFIQQRITIPPKSYTNP